MGDASTRAEAMHSGVHALVAGVLRADPAAIARMMREVEDDAPQGRAYVTALYPHTGRARVVGITGAPGAGKSTLVDQLVGAWRAQGLRVGVLAIDPSSPLHGGALLGDRIRMLRHTDDPGAYMRSMASRGQQGGLALRGGDLVDILDAAGMDVVVVETVGVGQDGVDVMRLAQQVVVVQSPGQGDDIQAMKAGILEIADVLVVNKCDLPGADRLVHDLKANVALLPADAARYVPPILRTQALSGEGIDELAQALLPGGIADRGVEHGRERVQRRLEHRFAGRLRELLLARLDAWLDDECCKAFNVALRERRIDPESAAQRAIQALLRATDDPLIKEFQP